MLKSLRGRAVVLITGATAAGILAGGVTAAAGAAVTPTGHWGNAHPVGGLNTGNTGGLAAVSSVSCGSPGNCVAVGNFHTSDHSSHGFFAVEQGGAWGQAAELLPGNSSTLDAVSCSDAADCVMIGHAIDSAPHPFFDIEAHGVWGLPTALGVNGLRGEPIAVSCVPGSPGNCAIGGWVNDAKGLAQPFTKGENNGTWGPVQQVTALENVNAGVDAQVSSVSCPAPGSCTAVGYVRTPSASHHPFITEEGGGQWTFGFPIPALSRITTNSAQANVVSCATAGECALAGDYTDGHGQQQVFVIDKAKGDWLLPQPVPGVADRNVGGFAEVKGVSCGSAGNCVVVGDYVADNRNTFAGFVAEEKNGTWQQARTIIGTVGSVPGSGSADSVSCPTAGNCVVGGSVGDQAGTHAITLSETNGTWGSPQHVPGMGALSKRVISGGRRRLLRVAWQLRRGRVLPGLPRQLAGLPRRRVDGDDDHAEAVRGQGQVRARAVREALRQGQAAHRRHSHREGHRRRRLENALHDQARQRQGLLHAGRQAAQARKVPADRGLRRRPEVRRLRLLRAEPHGGQVSE